MISLLIYFSVPICFQTRKFADRQHRESVETGPLCREAAVWVQLFGCKYTNYM